MRRVNADAALKARRAEVAHLYCVGWTQQRIAAKFSLTQQQISLDLAAIRKEWQRVMVESFDQYKAEQLAKIDATEQQAWRGWRRSLRDAESVKEKGVLIPPKAAIGDLPAEPEKFLVAERTSDREGQSGDPRFLQIIMDCVDKRLRVVGGYADKGGLPVAAGPVIVQVFGHGLKFADVHSETIHSETIDSSGHTIDAPGYKSLPTPDR